MVILYIMFTLDITKEGENCMIKIAESRMVVHTHTHTGSLLEKLSRRNI